MPDMSENAHFAQSVRPEREKKYYYRVDAFANPWVEATQSPDLKATSVVSLRFSPSHDYRVTGIARRGRGNNNRLIQVHWQC